MTKISVDTVVVLLCLLLLVLLVGCGGNDDPVLKELNDDLEVDIDDFSASHSSLYPGEELKVEWRTSGAVLFDARLYLSQDRNISADDWRLLDEDCGVEYADHCYANREVTFRCRYESDNSFSCREDGDLLQYNDLTDYFPQLPFSGYLILELCGDENCERRVHGLTFE
ncbi:hypothetical protein [Gilvimarinus algae]|uniref:Uncharacterized protein n=1 Tax=Gilvimarinus algae TaxID=3058037 RepID=A0ABT8T9F1_9GAMM|nr:hypothetical protein [Gilvimarinus sp. SDUM040014]MDO3380767.1 hypothetical protein [Gilvimarinus sp. SDUM040014]